MVEVNFVVNSLQLCLSDLLTSEQLKELALIEKHSMEKRVIEPQFLYEYSLQAELGFIPLVTSGQQAFCQALAHMGCIPASLSLGYSLSDAYPKTRRILCDINAYEYCFVAFERMLIGYAVFSFASAAFFMTNNRTLYEICEFLTSNSCLNCFDHQHHPVIAFAETCMAGLKNDLRLDA